MPCEHSRGIPCECSQGHPLRALAGDAPSSILWLRQAHPVWRGIHADLHALVEEEAEAYFGVLARSTATQTHTSDFDVMAEAFARGPYEMSALTAMRDLVCPPGGVEGVDTFKCLRDASRMSTGDYTLIQQKLGTMIEAITDGTFRYPRPFFCQTSAKGTLQRSDCTTECHSSPVEPIQPFPTLLSKLDEVVIRVRALAGATGSQNRQFAATATAALLRKLDSQFRAGGRIPMDISSPSSSASQAPASARRRRPRVRARRWAGGRSELPPGEFGFGWAEGYCVKVSATGGFAKYADTWFPVVGVHTSRDGSMWRFLEIQDVGADSQAPPVVIPRWSIAQAKDPTDNRVNPSDPRQPFTLERKAPDHSSTSDLSDEGASQDEDPS